MPSAGQRKRPGRGAPSRRLEGTDPPYTLISDSRSPEPREIKFLFAGCGGAVLHYSCLDTARAPGGSDTEEDRAPPAACAEGRRAPERRWAPGEQGPGGKGRSPTPCCRPPTSAVNAKAAAGAKRFQSRDAPAGGKAANAPTLHTTHTKNGQAKPGDAGSSLRSGDSVAPRPVPWCPAGSSGSQGVTAFW